MEETIFFGTIAMLFFVVFCWSGIKKDGFVGPFSRDAFMRDPDNWMEGNKPEKGCAL